MVKFDKMKIVAPLSCVKNIDDTKFIESYLGEELISHKYEQKQPCLLGIRLDYRHNELMLEFTGKILGDDYPRLINKETFIDCLRRIENMGIINLDFNGILKFGQITKCDVTCDVNYSDLDGFLKFIKANLASYDRWEDTKYHNGLSIKNKVSTDRHKKRLIVYDKEQELNMASNAAFLNSLKDKDTLLNYFRGKVRFEQNLTTKESIRRALSIHDNSIDAVLSSSATPIADILNEAVKPADTCNSTPASIKDFITDAVLCKCNYDLAQLEAVFRGIASKNSCISRMMKPYKEYMNRNEPFDFDGLIRLVR